MEYTGLDGIREDTYPYPDQTFLADWAKAILDEYPASNIVGEIWALQSSYLAMFQTKSKLPRDFETNLPSIMDFALCESLRNFLNGKGKLMQVYDVIAQDFLYSDVDNIMTFIDNHDMTRGIYEAKGNTERLKTALTILFTTRGIPQLLYGNEIDMVGGESHVKLRADFPGGFHWHNRNAFTAEGRTARENDMFNYTQKLLQLRKEHPALTEGKLIQYPVQWKPDVYMYFRIHESETILVIANGEYENAIVDLSDIAYRLKNVKSFKNLMTGEILNVDVDKGINMEGLSALVLKLE
jgi:glycosidase